MIRWIISVFFVLSSLTSGAQTIEVASKRYPITAGDVTAYLPYESSHDLSVKNEQITRIIYSIHSASYSAKSYYSRAAAMVEKKKGEKDKTLIIAPHFLPKGSLDKPGTLGILYWEFPAFWGTSRGFFNDKRISISTYDVTDRMLEELAGGGNFPNLKTIVILGHSGGGQMVNRYAASGQFENKVARDRGIEVRYIVMAPSSYVYFNGQRAAKGSSTQFSIPDNPPDRYNCWGYGMESLFVFHRKHKISPEKIINDYPAKRILYLVGSKDNDQNDASLDKKPPAMLQGRDRRERAKVYYNYLKHFYGQKIKGNQYFKIVKNAGHSGRQLMLSRQAILFTFAPNRKR